MVKRSSSIPRARADLSEAVAASFRQALKLRDHREAQIADGKRCKGVGLCEVCDQYERLVAIVNAAVGVKASELSPVDVIDGPAPPMWTDHQQATGIARATSMSSLPRLPGSSHGRRRCSLTPAVGKPTSGGSSDRAKSLTVHLSVSRSACWSSSERLSVGFTPTLTTGRGQARGEEEASRIAFQAYQD